MASDTPKILGLSRGRLIALTVAIVFVIIGIVGFANASRISQWMESSSALSTTEPSTNMPTVDDADTTVDDILDPSTSVSSDGTIDPPVSGDSVGSKDPDGGMSVPGNPGTAPSPKPSAPAKPAKPSSVKPKPEAEVPPAPAPAPESKPEAPKQLSVSVRVNTSAAAAKGYSGSINTSSRKVTVTSGASALEASQKSGLSFKTTSTGFGPYVAAIGDLSEKDYGGSSGWTYSVNGSSPSKTSAKYTLKDGDSIVWTYVIR